MEFRSFRLRGKTYYHLESGWCAKLIEKKDHSGQNWRLYWGVLRPGSHRPMVVQPYIDPDENYIDLDSLDDCFQWVEGRKKHGLSTNS